MDTQYENLYQVFSAAFRDETNHGKDFRYTAKQKDNAKIKTAFFMNRLVNTVLLPSFIEMHLGDYINIFITTELKMFLVLTNEGKEFLQEKIDQNKNIRNDQLLYKLLEDHRCNGFDMIPAEYCGMTDCNLILTHSNWGLEFSHKRDFDYKDRYWHELLGMDENSCNTRKMVTGDYIWHDPNYQIRSQVEDLFNDGIIELELHEF